jgi:hypothetical protein
MASQTSCSKRAPASQSTGAARANVVRETRFSPPLQYIVNAEGDKTAVIMSIQDFDLMTMFMEAYVNALNADTEGFISQEALERLFADYGVRR